MVRVNRLALLWILGRQESLFLFPINVSAFFSPIEVEAINFFRVVEETFGT